MRAEVRVEGIVQGVGFRPFVHQLASRLGLAGLVGNDAGGVFVEVEGASGAVEAFVRALSSEAPPLAVVDRVTARPLPVRGQTGCATCCSAVASGSTGWSCARSSPCRSTLVNRARRGATWMGRWSCRCRSASRTRRGGSG